MQQEHITAFLKEAKFWIEIGAQKVMATVYGEDLDLTGELCSFFENEAIVLRVSHPYGPAAGKGRSSMCLVNPDAIKTIVIWPVHDDDNWFKENDKVVP